MILEEHLSFGLRYSFEDFVDAHWRKESFKLVCIVKESTCSVTELLHQVEDLVGVTVKAQNNGKRISAFKVWKR